MLFKKKLESVGGILPAPIDYILAKKEKTKFSMKVKESETSQNNIVIKARNETNTEIEEFFMPKIDVEKS